MVIRSKGGAERAERSKGAPGKRPNERHNRRSEILDAATDVFWRKGYSAASVQDIADSVGILKGSLYYYIDSKEDLLFSIFDLSHTEAWKIVEEVKVLDAPPLERLRVYLRRYGEYFLRNVERMSLYFRDWRSLGDERYEIVLEQRRMYDEFICGLIREAQDRGDVAPELEARYAAYFILGAFNGIADWYSREGQDSVETIASVYAEQSLAMLTGNTNQSLEPR